jgi:hypothetical protein
VPVWVMLPVAFGLQEPSFQLPTSSAPADHHVPAPAPTEVRPRADPPPPPTRPSRP